jgi:TolB-like protein
VAILAAGAAHYFATHRSNGAAIPEKSIAVLPLVNSTGDPANGYSSDGISEEFISSLSRLQTSRSSDEPHLFSSRARLTTAGRSARSSAFIIYSKAACGKSAGRVRIAVELVKSSDGANVWSDTYDRELKDICAVQSEIAGAVAKELKVALLGNNGQTEQLATAATPSNQHVAAYNALLQGNFYSQRKTADDYRKAISYYEEAIRFDPRYALAYASCRSSRPSWSMFSPALRPKRDRKSSQKRAPPVKPRSIWIRISLRRIGLKD